MEKQNLISYLEWLITPQDSKETTLFKENNLVDDYVSIKNNINGMSEQQLIKEINNQLYPYNLSV